MKERFEQKFIPEPMSGCWLWTACTYRGYGLFAVNGKAHRAHRLAYELYVGPIGDGKIIRHLCDNPACVNPQHLASGTMKDNCDDRDRQNRNAHKLTTEEIAEIRHLYLDTGEIQENLALAYGVSQAQISRVCAGMRSGRTKKQSESIRGMMIARP